MTSLGVWGLGAMGMPILDALAETHDAIGYDLEAGRTERAVSSVGELVGADVIMVVLPGADAVRRALLDVDPSPIRAMRPGALLVELSSADPRVSRRIAEVARDAGVHYVAAPMAGGPQQARDRTLRFYAAGPTDAVDRALPLLRELAAPGGITIVGADPAQAQAVKLAVNAVWFSQAAVVTEAMLFAARAGVDADAMRRILNDSAAGSAFTRDYLPRLLAGDDVASFGIDGILEELRTVVDVSRDGGSPASTIAHTLALHERARETFGPVAGELLVARLLEGEAGMPLRADPSIEPPREFG